MGLILIFRNGCCKWLRGVRLWTHLGRGRSWSWAVIAAAAVLALAGMPGAGLGAPVKFPAGLSTPEFKPDKPETLEIEKLIQALFKDSGLEPDVSDEAKKVSGGPLPDGRPRKAWMDAIAAAKHLVFFADGKKVHVSTAGEYKEQWYSMEERVKDMMLLLLLKEEHVTPDEGKAWKFIFENDLKPDTSESKKGYWLVGGPPALHGIVGQWLPSVKKTEEPEPGPVEHVVRRVHLRHARVDSVTISTTKDTSYDVPGVYDLLCQLLGKPAEGSSLAAQIGETHHQSINLSQESGEPEAVVPEGGSVKLSTNSLTRAIEHKAFIEALPTSAGPIVDLAQAKLQQFRFSRSMSDLLKQNSAKIGKILSEPAKAQEALDKIQKWFPQSQYEGKTGLELLRRPPPEGAQPVPGATANGSSKGRSLPLPSILPPLDGGREGSGVVLDAPGVPEDLRNLGSQFLPHIVEGDEAMTLVYKDSRTNSIIVVAPKEKMQFLMDLIGQLDVAQPLVEISAATVDINSEVAFEWNNRLAFSARSEVGDRPGFFAGGFDAPKGSFDGELKSDPPGLTQSLVEGAGLNAFGLNAAGMLVGESYRVLARFHALESEGQAQILSRPTVLTLDNTESRLSDTSTFYVRVAGTEDAQLFKISAAVTIRVIPQVVLAESEGRPTQVKLIVHIEDGAPSEEETNDGIPVVNTSYISTQAVVRDGESLLLGGRYRHEETKGQGHVPFVGKIPLVGLPFKGKLVDHRKLQRLFMITPRIVNPDTYYDEARLRMEQVLSGSFSPPKEDLRREQAARSAPDGKSAATASASSDGRPTFFQRLFRRAPAGDAAVAPVAAPPASTKRRP